jgi:hypothetical protein
MPHPPLPDVLFQGLQGHWLLSRAIPGRATMTGTAHFERVAQGVLHYRERGQLTLASGAVIGVTREYVYSLEGESIRIAFPAGGTLHRLRFAPSPSPSPWPMEARDVHECGADTYSGRYRYESERRWSVLMVVRGPGKDYSIHTTMERPAAGGSAVRDDHRLGVAP